MWTQPIARREFDKFWCCKRTSSMLNNLRGVPVKTACIIHYIGMCFVSCILTIKKHHQVQYYNIAVVDIV